MTKLKKCPFCGSLPTWHIGGAEHDLLFFGCPQPQQCVHWVTPFTKPYFENALQIATNRWNTRIKETEVNP